MKLIYLCKEVEKNKNNLQNDLAVIQELSSPSEVDLGVGVTVVKNHGEEFSGWLQRGFLVHLIMDLMTSKHDLTAN